MIRVSDLEKTHGKAKVLRGVSFDVAEGRLVALLGRSGAGKSTLLRCLVGLDGFDHGTIRVGDVEVGGASAASRAQRSAAARALRGRVGLVFQQFELFPHLTVLDNCTLAPVMAGRWSAGEAAARAQRLLDELGVGDKAGAYPELLSGGQRQRVAIARALAVEPRVLLYDEPTSALDPSLRLEIRDTLLRVKNAQVTQVVVTHDVSLASDCAEEIFVLDEGRIVERGAPEQVLRAPRSEAARRLVSARGGQTP